MENKNAKLVFKAEFHPLLRIYLFFYVLFFLLISVIGIVVLPFWIFGLGMWAVNRYYRYLSCVLTERTVEFRKGYLFRMEKTILLEKIQDVTLREGPVLRALGLCRLDLETAGRSGNDTGAEAKLVGIVDARDFRDRILKQRDRLLTGEEEDLPVPEKKEKNLLKILGEIRDSVQKIEEIINIEKAKSG
jgi:putative membrane protein